jgi:riboflavin transporter FmnP
VAQLNVKAVGVTAAFTALATVLNLIKIPAPYFPMFNYQLGDIVLVIAFFLFGLKIGFATLFLNVGVTMVLNPTLIGVVGAPYYALAVFTMILGAYISLKVIKRRQLNTQFSEVKTTALATVFAIITRTLIMLPSDLFVYKFLVAFVTGSSLADSLALITATIPFFIIYNVTVPLLVIPVSYYISKHVPSTIDSSLFKQSIV